MGCPTAGKPRPRPDRAAQAVRAVQADHRRGERLGDRMPAAEAHRIGLVNEVVEPERVLPRAEELAARLAKNGPLALRKIKEAVLRTSGEPLARAYEIENECSAVVMASKDAREGPRAFMEKREPVFTGE